MRNVFTVLLLSAMFALTASAVSAQSNPPQDGIYKTQNGDFLEGHYSISFPGGNSFMDSGNRLHVESWDGSVLGTEWRIICPFIANVTQISYTDFGGGSYQASYFIEYTGGTVWLSGAGIWGGGDPSYTATITSYSEARSVLVLGGTLTGLNSDHNVTAHVDLYPSDCIAFGIGNSEWFGTTTTHGPKPASYPAFLDANCDPNGTAGHWGTATDLTLTVSGCEVGTEESTWGSVKSKYR